MAVFDVVVVVVVVAFFSRGESQGVMLCSGVCGDSGHGRITRCHVVLGVGGDSGQRRITRCHVVFRGVW